MPDYLELLVQFTRPLCGASVSTEGDTIEVGTFMVGNAWVQHTVAVSTVLMNVESMLLLCANEIFLELTLFS